MVKRRPVVVLSQALKRRTGLVTVTALSTVRPDPIMDYHCFLPKNCLPQTAHFQGEECWVKGDMVYTVGFRRLDSVMLGKRDPNTGKRLYYTNRLSRERMAEIYKCVLHGLSLGALAKYLGPPEEGENT